jgi:hypothetical protein
MWSTIPYIYILLSTEIQHFINHLMWLKYSLNFSAGWKNLSIRYSKILSFECFQNTSNPYFMLITKQLHGGCQILPTCMNEILNGFVKKIAYIIKGQVTLQWLNLQLFLVLKRLN